MLDRLIRRLRGDEPATPAAAVRPKATAWPPKRRRRGRRGGPGAGGPPPKPRVPEVYVSVDVEADGPVPGLHSMRALGAAAFRLDAPDPFEPVAVFEANLHPLAGAEPHPRTMAWWARRPEAWAALEIEPRDPAEAMPAFLAWTGALEGTPVFAGYPVAFDFMWVRWYLERFCGEGGPFPYAGLDVRTLAMDRLGIDYRDVARDRFPDAWRSEAERTREDRHVALADAIEQGRMLVRILREPRGTAGP